MSILKGILLILGLCAFLICIAFIISALVTPYPLMVSGTEEITTETEWGELEVEIPISQLSVPTIRSGIPITSMVYIMDDPATKQIAEYLTDKTDGWSKMYKVQAVTQYVNDNVTYLPEKVDHWQLPYETIKKGTGDCDDFALLTVSILLNMGFNAVLFVGDLHCSVGVYTGTVDGYGLEYDGKFYNNVEPQHVGFPGEVEFTPEYALKPGFTPIICIFTLFWVLMACMLIYVETIGLRIKDL